VGWFPATYVKVLAGGRMSGRNTPLSSSKIDLHETVIGEKRLLIVSLIVFANRSPIHHFR
jgi:hypothetical protein